nr:MAG TPA: hypothetical protein [Caudoviricetes sp.]
MILGVRLAPQVCRMGAVPPYPQGWACPRC